MKRKTEQPGLPPGLEKARGRFERWRETRPGGRPRIPESLWSLATRAARQFGVHRTCRALRLDYVVLKRRVEAEGAHDPARREARHDHPPGFVELVPAGPNSGTECVVEIEDPSGSRMRIELKGVAAADVVALTRSLRAGAA